MSTPAAGAGAAAREVLGRLLQNMTQPELFAATGITPRMQRKVLKAATPGTGAAYLPALRQLATDGRVRKLPPVRQQMVRAPGGAKVQAPARPVKPAVVRGRYGTTVTQVASGRGKVIEISAPASNGAGRDKARGDMLDALQRAAKGKRRVAFIVEAKDGTRVTLGARGGYAAGDALRRARATVTAGVVDPLGWIDAEAEGIDRYAFDGPGVLYVLTVF